MSDIREDGEDEAHGNEVDSQSELFLGIKH